MSDSKFCFIMAAIYTAPSLSNWGRLVVACAFVVFAVIHWRYDEIERKLGGAA